MAAIAAHGRNKPAWPVAEASDAVVLIKYELPFLLFSRSPQSPARAARRIDPTSRSHRNAADHCRRSPTSVAQPSDS